MSRGCWWPLYTHWVKLSRPVVFPCNLASSFSLSESVDHSRSSLLSFSPSAETMESSLTLLLPFIFSHWTILIFLLLSHLSLLPLAYLESSSLFWKIRVAYQLATLLLAAGRSNLPCHLRYLPKYWPNLSVHWQPFGVSWDYRSICFEACIHVSRQPSLSPSFQPSLPAPTYNYLPLSQPTCLPLFTPPCIYSLLGCLPLHTPSLT